MSCANKQYSVIQLRRGSSSEFASSNIVLASGEPGYAVDAKLFKIGDGITPWNDLATPYTSGSYFIFSSGNNLLVDKLSFNTSITQDLLKGQLGWNDTEGTINIALTDNTDIHIGEHSFYRLRNETGSPLYKGQAVYATGVHPNGIINPAKYTADGSVREIRFIGLMLEDLSHNNNGYAIQFGHIENIDTRGNVASNIAVGDETWVAGDILYVHPSIAGKLTKNEPKHSIAVAIILSAASNGRIFVRPTSYGHLNDNHDVSTSGATNGQFLQYNSSTDYWIPSSSGNFSELFINGSGVPTLEYVNNLLAANDAMIFKGTLGTGGTITNLPSVYNAGWSYKVITAGTYAGNVCEIGDLVIAIVDRPSGGGTNSDWVVVQSNIEDFSVEVNGVLSSLSTISNHCDVKYVVIQDSGNITKVVDISNLAESIQTIDGGGVTYNGC